MGGECVGWGDRSKRCTWHGSTVQFSTVQCSAVQCSAVQSIGAIVTK
jgi:hypothetical protein